MRLTLNQPAENAPTEGWQINLLSWCVNTIAASRVIILLCLVFFVGNSMLKLRATTPQYRVEALLVQNSEPSSNLRAVSTTGLAGLLGGGGGTSSPEIDEFTVLMSSPEVATDIDNKYHLLHDVFQGAWDSKLGRWRPPSWGDSLRYRIIEAVGGLKHQDPNNYDLAKFIGSGMTFSHSEFGSVMSLSMNTDRPEDAKRWLNIVIYEVSDVIRSQMITERQKYIDYLQQQISQSSLASSRDAIISILADQYRTLMVLKSAKTFPLQQIQPPTRAQFPTNKSVSLFLMYGILEGFLVAGILITLGVRDSTIWRLLPRLFSYLRKR